MHNVQRWVQPMLLSIYVALLSLFWFHAVQFLFRRFDIPAIPEIAVLLLIGIGIVTVLPLSFLSISQRKVWTAIMLFAGIALGYLLYNDLVTFVILVLGSTWFSVKKVDDTIGALEIVHAFMAIVIFFGFSFIVSFFFTVQDIEVQQLIRFLLLSLIVTVAGTTIAKLYTIDTNIDVRNQFKQWGKYNGWVWGMLAALGVVSALALFILLGVIPLIGALIKAILTPIVTKIFAVIPWLSEQIARLFAELPEQEMDDAEFENNAMEQLQQTDMHPWASQFWDVVFYGITVVLIALVVVAIVKAMRTKKQSKGTEVHVRDAIAIESLPSATQGGNDWLRSLKSFFNPYSALEEHPVRKQYRQILKQLRKKGLWDHEAMTVQQIEARVQQLGLPSALYEKLRYGDQTLSEAEIAQFSERIKAVKDKLSKME